MDDLTKKISDLLNSPDGIQKLQAAAASMGILSGGNSDQEPSVDTVPASKPPSSDISGLLGGDMAMISKLMPLVSNFSHDNQDTMLLKALRPYLEDGRQQRLDETIKIMHLLKVLPILKEKGGLF